MEGRRITADLLLMHAPAYFDFREEKHVYFPFMSTSGDVPITPVYEFFPMGFKSLKEYIGQYGFDVQIFNLCSYMLQNKEADIKKLIEGIRADIIGIDLHWLVHVQGALAVAELVKEVHKDVKILFGGISSSYYAKELIRYDFIDFVMRGYDTHKPMAALVTEVKGEKRFERVPNLMWKKEGQVVENPMDYCPDHMNVGITWKEVPEDSKTLLPLHDIISTTNAGCKKGCGWCGGSNAAFRRIYGGKNSPVFKSDEALEGEFASLRYISDVSKFNFYSCGNYNLSDKQLRDYLERLRDHHFKSINYEEYWLPSRERIRSMVEICSNSIVTLSPESSNQRISKLAGRGNYSMSEMEEFIDYSLELGLKEVDIWFFIGMPEQDEKAVWDDVRYFEHLLKKYRGKLVVPLICPLMPFLDPASNFFENPDRYGYRVFYRTVQQHREGMQHASIINRLNYETKWLSREQIVKMGYKAIRELFLLKAEYNAVPGTVVSSVVRRLEDAMEFIDVIHRIDNIRDERERNRELRAVEEEIYRRNQEVFFKGVLNQAFPVERKHGQRWFDYV